MSRATSPTTRAFLTFYYFFLMPRVPLPFTEGPPFFPSPGFPPASLSFDVEISQSWLAGPPNSLFGRRRLDPRPPPHGIVKKGRGRGDII